MPTSTLPDGQYRIRQAGAKSEIANLISNGKKCFYLQIGSDLTRFDNLEEAVDFVAGKGLVADSMSLDFGVKPKPEAEPEADSESKPEAAADEAESDAAEA